MIKERFQNPTVGNQIKLRLLSYNSNNRADLDSISKVEIYFLDPNEQSNSNPTGKRLVETIDGAEILQDDVGAYSITVELSEIGNWVDVWYATVGDEEVQIENQFQIYPNLWFTTPIPIIYDFNFAFRPNRLAKGSKRYLAIGITPNVPNKNELVAYYENLAIVSPITITITQRCGDCLPAESDLRIVVEDAEVPLREKCMAYYFLDTTDMETGIYDVVFKLDLGESVYISDAQQLSII